MTVRLSTSVANVAGAVGSRLDGSPLVILLDVDGTLAPIVPRPEEAAVPAQTRAVLERLRDSRGVHIALVSGRGAEDALRVARMQAVWVIGNHGIELLDPNGQTTVDATAARYRPNVDAAAEALMMLHNDIPGARIEHKGWTISVHYRLVDAKLAPELRRRAHEIAQRTGLQTFDGKKIVELRPPALIHKGTASIALVQRLGGWSAGASVLYVGDDRTDEDAIIALREHDPDVVTVHVQSHEADMQRLVTRAEFQLGTTEDVRDLLEWLASRRAS